MDVQRVPLDLIDPPLVVSRLQLETPAFEELVADIREHGITVPLLLAVYETADPAPLARIPDEGRVDTLRVTRRYRVVDGYRRYNAAKRLGLLEVPAIVQPADEQAELSTLMRVALHRADLTPVEEGVMFQAMHEGLHLTPQGIAEQVGKSRAYVEARMTLAAGDEAVVRAVQAGEVTFSVALELLRVEHPKDREWLLYHAVRGGCTTETMRGWVRDALVRRAAAPAGADPAAPVVSAAAPPVILGDCAWHDGKVPVVELRSLQVCADCYAFLLQTRNRVAAEPAAAGGGGDGGHRPA